MDAKKNDRNEHEQKKRPLTSTPLCSPPLPFIATFSMYIILWLLHKFSNICKPEEGWYGQPKYCYKKQYTLF